MLKNTNKMKIIKYTIKQKEAFEKLAKSNASNAQIISYAKAENLDEKKVKQNVKYRRSRLKKEFKPQLKYTAEQQVQAIIFANNNTSSATIRKYTKQENLDFKKYYSKVTSMRYLNKKKGYSSSPKKEISSSPKITHINRIIEDRKITISIGDINVKLPSKFKLKIDGVLIETL